MHNEFILVKKSGPLTGKVLVSGAKNAALPIMASLVLTSGISILKNVPHLTDIESMVGLLEELGAKVTADYAAVCIAKECGTWKEHKALTTETIKNPAIK